ncbi:hypothetical protein NQ314_012467 [Rhamnusium bicolor]|uniref:Uncharacterized protein n=1 Tax=Rhamnusium bicolor TaxID=1586634 RepID=A0AAV8XCJ6_9CUCU|nr:hypothetical protein NQ314_012467 [Rhamnusium bicolor]
MEQSKGENVDVSQRQEQGDVVAPQVLDVAQLMQQITALVANQMAQLTDKISESNEILRNKISETNETIAREINLVKREMSRENKNLRDQIELTNLNLNTKIDTIAANLEKQILSKVANELHNRVGKLQVEIEHNRKQIEGKIMNIDEQYASNLHVINKKLEAEDDNLREQINKIGKEKMIQYVCSRAPQTEMNIVFYGDRRIHPKIFVKNLKEYLETLSEDINVKSYIRNSLKGDAEIWYSIVEDKYETFEEFVAVFLANYLGENHQSKIRENLFNGKYRVNVGLSRERYILKKYNYVRHLEPRMPDSEIVKYFARHFSDNIRDVILIQGIDTIEKMLQYLRRIDDVKTQTQQDNIGDDKEDEKCENRNTRRDIENTNYNKDRNQGWKNYKDNRRNNDGYNRNYRRYDYRGYGRQANEENQGTNQDENQEEKRNETKKTEWNRIEEITTAMVEPGSKNQNF